MNKSLTQSKVFILFLIFTGSAVADASAGQLSLRAERRDARALQHSSNRAAPTHDELTGRAADISENGFINVELATATMPDGDSEGKTSGQRNAWSHLLMPLPSAQMTSLDAAVARAAGFGWHLAAARPSENYGATRSYHDAAPTDSFVRFDSSSLVLSGQAAISNDKMLRDRLQGIAPAVKIFNDTRFPTHSGDARGMPAIATDNLPSASTTSRAVTHALVYADNEGSSLTAAKDAYGTTWKPIRIGAGGWITGIDIANDGTMIIRTDTYGAYLWDRAANQWVQLVNANSMPTEDVGVDKNSGVYEIRIAPSDTSRFYMMYRGYIYRSQDKGAHWTRTAFPQVADASNDSYRMCGQKMAVDPANPDVVYAGTPSRGLWTTSNAGASWTQVPTVPESSSGGGGITGIGFDPTSGQRGGKTKTIYASSWGNRVYRSVDAGESWTPLTGGPSNVNHGKIAPDGGYYVAGDNLTKVWRYLAEKWTDITPSSDGWGGIITDPFDAAHIVAIRPGGALDISHDRGASWGGVIWGTPAHPNTRVATDVPWLAWTNETYMSEGDMVFDPFTPNKLWFAEGIGVWYANVPPNNPWSMGITWHSQNTGIEQLVAYTIVAPPGGKPVVGSGDRPVFYIDNPDVYPSVHGPDNESSIISGFAMDYAATDPSFIAGIFNWPGKEKSAYSTDGGRTWKQFASKPADAVASKIGGCLAVNTPSNIVWVTGNNGNPYYTKDGGKTWIQISLPNVPTSGNTGWVYAYFLDRHIAAADRVASGTFYLYNYLKGLYRSTDGGATWVLAKAGQIAPWSGFNAKLKSVPGRSGHLFFTSGQLGNPGDPKPTQSGIFMHSTDGGSRWTAIPNVREVYDFGFGKAATDDGYPAIYIVGWVNGQYGVWQSDNQGGSWTQIGKWPTGSLDYVKAVQGDMNIYGRVYIGFSGSGYVYGDRSTMQTSRP